MGTTKENEMARHSDIYAEQGQRGSANLQRVIEREAANVRCTICGATDCKVGGLHGVIRDRAAAAAKR